MFAKKRHKSIFSHSFEMIGKYLHEDIKYKIIFVCKRHKSIFSHSFDMVGKYLHEDDIQKESKEY